MNRRFIAYILFCAAAGVLCLVAPTSAQAPAATDMITNGDVNNDGVFDIFDIMRMERTVSLGMGAKDEELSAGDVDGNGRIDKFDLLVMNEALKNVNDGMPMFESVKQAIDSDLSKTTDNVETYLDLSRFYKKEQMLQRSRGVLESILEALETDHPLYNQVVGDLNAVKQAEMLEIEAAEDFLNQDPYEAAGDLVGKTSLRRSVVQLKGKLSKLMDDQQFGAHYNSKRVKSQLGNVMDDMLRKVGQDQMVDAGAFDQFNADIRGVLENPENLVKQLTPQQRSRINGLVDNSTSQMRQEAVKLRQDFQRTAESGSAAARSAGLGESMLNRDESRLQNNLRSENMEAQGRVPANAPVLSPDTISIVNPPYVLTWDVSNILGAKNSALEISKANAKFSNPRGTAPDEEATLYYTPSLGTVKGERRGSALELEGVGTYYYRVAALNNNGELISRFSDATPLVVVYNNLDIAANKPEVEPEVATPDDPEYTFRWDVTNVEGARDAAVEISKPNTYFGNPNGRARDRLNSFFFNPSLGRTNGTFSSSINGLAGPGTYLFRVIAVSSSGDFMGQWSDPDTLTVTTGDGSLPVPASPTTPSSPSETPQPPEFQTTDDGFSINWDVGNISGASGVSLELAKLAADSNNSGENQVEEMILSESLDSTAGNLNVESGLLADPGRYQVRIAAVDSAGNMLSGWSEPSVVDLRDQPPPERSAPDTAGENMQVATREETAESPGGESATAQNTGQNAAADTMASSPEEEPVQPPPTGRTLEVSRNNTPLYEQNNPSSPEVASLQKGEKLILVSTNGLWHNVYYAMGGKYGWVLSFNVAAAEEQSSQ